MKYVQFLDTTFFTMGIEVQEHQRKVQAELQAIQAKGDVKIDVTTTTNCNDRYFFMTTQIIYEK